MRRAPASDASRGLALARLQRLHQIGLLLWRKREALPVPSRVFAVEGFRVQGVGQNRERQGAHCGGR